MVSRWLLTVFSFLVSVPAWSGEVALVTSIQGKATRMVDLAPVAVESFIKVNEGDRLNLEKDTRIQLVYFANGRQETWSGSGRIEITANEGRASGLVAPEVKSWPMVMAGQLARTPALDGIGRGGPSRFRAIPTQDAMAKLEDTYYDLRNRAGPNDLGPEMYLLSGLFEMRELDRVERVLGDLQQDRPTNPEAALLVSLYKRAINNARQMKK